MNEEIDKEKFDELLNGFNKLTFKERQNPTFLELIKQPAKETAWSNILAFYFDPKREHGLGVLMLKSFFEALGEDVEIENLNSIKVRTEVSTENRKRIDLVIEADNFVLGIENKVDHWLNNDLEEYSKKIDTLLNIRLPFKVVLSKFHCCPDHGFINLTYDVLIKQVNKNLPIFIANANLEYLTFLNDFLRNIENTIKFKEMIENEQAFEYFKLNYNEMKVLTSKFTQFKEEIEQKFRDIRDVIDSKKTEESIKQKFGEVTVVGKSDIEENNGVSTFWINVFIEEIKIEFSIYIDHGYDVYCYAISEDEPTKSKIDPEIYGCSTDLNKDTKVIVQEIYDFIEQMMGNVYKQ